MCTARRCITWQPIRRGRECRFTCSFQTRPAAPRAGSTCSRNCDPRARDRGRPAGHCRRPHRAAEPARGEHRNQRAVPARLHRSFELDQVVVHGWSAGGMIALLFADLAPGRVDGLVLVAPALPPPLSNREARMWQTLGRAGLAVVAPVARVLLRVSGRRILTAKLRLLADPTAIAGSKWNTGGDLTRCRRKSSTSCGTSCRRSSRREWGARSRCSPR